MRPTIPQIRLKIRDRTLPYRHDDDAIEAAIEDASPNSVHMGSMSITLRTGNMSEIANCAHTQARRITR